jgi:hypothetical protein
MHLVETELTKEQKEYLQTLFWSYQEDIEEKIHKKMVDEFHLLSKYKGELARKFTELNGFHGTLLGCMTEMLDKQEALFEIHHQLLHMIIKTHPELQKELEIVA